MTKKITLAIETAVGNGSFSLFAGLELIDQMSGGEQIARSDSFLPILANFLARSEVDKTDLNLIAVSRGPGSFTGMRVGLTAALALSNGLKIDCLGVSVLRAMSATVSEPFVVAAIVNDKDEVIWRNFSETITDDCDNPELGEAAEINRFDDFCDRIRSARTSSNFIFEQKLYQKILAAEKSVLFRAWSNKNKIINAGANLSYYIGNAALHNQASDNLSPLYLDTNKIYG